LRAPTTQLQVRNPLPCLPRKGGGEMAKAKALVFACFLLLAASAAAARSLGGGQPFGSRKHPASSFAAALPGRVVARRDEEFTSLPIESSVARACVFVERFAHHVFGCQSLCSSKTTCSPFVARQNRRGLHAWHGLCIGHACMAWSMHRICIVSVRCMQGLRMPPLRSA
jgi:hypothetical protein